MTPLFQKLNLGTHREIVVLNAPAEFEPELAALTEVTIRRLIKGNGSIPFLIAFVKTANELNAVTVALDRAIGDAVVWFA